MVARRSTNRAEDATGRSGKLRQPRHGEHLVEKRSARNAADTSTSSRAAKDAIQHAAAAESESTGRHELDLDRLIHERIRLGILSALAVNRSLSFNDLKQLLKTTDGNLSVHARKLEEAEYIGCNKYFEGRVPKTEYRLTAQGRRALESYLDEMESLIRTTRQGQD